MTIEKKSRITALTRNFKPEDGSVLSVEAIRTWYFEDSETGEITVTGTEPVSDLTDADLQDIDTTAKGLVDITSLQNQVSGKSLAEITAKHPDVKASMIPIQNLEQVFENPNAQQMVLSQTEPDGTESKRVRTVAFEIEG